MYGLPGRRRLHHGAYATFGESDDYRNDELLGRASTSRRAAPASSAASTTSASSPTARSPTPAPGFTGVFGVASGKRRELDGPGTAPGWTLVAGGAAGVRLWPDDKQRARVVVPGPAGDVAISDGFVAGVVSWLDGAGETRAASSS